MEKEGSLKNPNAVALGQLGGLKGGNARAKVLSADERSRIAKLAAEARWKKSQMKDHNLVGVGMADIKKVRAARVSKQFTARCPHCNHSVSIHIGLETWGPNAKYVNDPELIAKIDARVGKARDGQIAAELGINSSIVRNRRLVKGVPVYNLLTDDVLWAEVDPLFPTHTNSEIVRKFVGKFNPLQIGRRRMILGIPLPTKGDQTTVREKVYKLHAAGFNQPEIAVAVRLSRQRIEQILIDYVPPTGAQIV